MFDLKMIAAASVPVPLPGRVFYFMGLDGMPYTKNSGGVVALVGTVAAATSGTLALWLKGEGTNGGAVVVDSSPTPKTITNTAVTTSTAAAKVGVSALLFNGTTSRLDFAVDSALTLGARDFDFDFYLRPGAIGNRQNLLYWNGNASGYAGLALQVCATGKLGLSVSESGTGWRIDDASVGVGAVLTAGAFCRVKVRRRGLIFDVLVDDVLQWSYSPLSAIGAPLLSVHTLNQIGAYNSSSSRFGGHLDDLTLTTY